MKKKILFQRKEKTKSQNNSIKSIHSKEASPEKTEKIEAVSTETINLDFEKNSKKIQVKEF